MKFPFPLRLLVFICSSAFLAGPVYLSAASQGLDKISGADLRFEATDGLKVVRDESAGVLRFDRILDVPAKGYRWDSPGARIRFRTDSLGVSVHLRYTERHIAGARNGVGFYRIDGRSHPDWRFDRPPASNASVRPASAAVEVRMDASRPGFHDYEIILPYGDSVDFEGATVARGAGWERPSPRPTRKYVAYGDSVTHGFTASDVTKGYPFQIAEKMGWQLLNAGYGGRGTSSGDADFVASLGADVTSVLIGVNDWQGGVPVRSYRYQLDLLLRRLRDGMPGKRIYVITPLWVAPSWKPQTMRYPLDEYRAAAREVVADLGASGITVVEGPSLIDPDPALFDRVAVHPNDAGFAQMAERLAEIMGE